MKKILITLILIFSNSSIYSQIISFDKIEDSSITKWIPKYMIEYEGIYRFGISEGESELIIIYGLDNIIAQIKYYEWSDKIQGFKTNFKTLINVEIEKDGRFISKLYHGEFVRYYDNGEYKKGLKIDNPWTSDIHKGIYEVGLRDSYDGYFYGDYHQVSLRILDKNELKKLTKDELQIMRNEVYARYGYKFKNKGKMSEYFESKDWYYPEYIDVTQFLTQIELINIELIKEIENDK